MADRLRHVGRRFVVVWPLLKEAVMSKWTKRIVLALFVAVPVIGFAATKYARHASCPSTPDCPCDKK